jgi:hypothetical protein
MSLTSLSVRRPVGVGVLAAMVCVIGGIAISR